MSADIELAQEHARKEIHHAQELFKTYYAATDVVERHALLMLIEQTIRQARRRLRYIIDHTETERL